MVTAALTIKIPRKFLECHIRQLHQDLHHFTSFTSTNSTHGPSQLDDFDQLHLENVFECQLKNVYELYEFVQS